MNSNHNIFGDNEMSEEQQAKIIADLVKANLDQILLNEQVSA